MKADDVRLIVPAIVGVFVLAFAVAYAAPIFDSSLAKEGQTTTDYSAEALRGKSVYESEGCWYCHTQSVRAIPNDLGLGKVTSAERIANDEPPLPGSARVGQDLGCVGDRLKDFPLIDYLKEPRSQRDRSKMPSFRYLSGRQLSDLAAYLQALTCEART